VINITWDHGFKRIYKKKIKNDDELKKASGSHLIEALLKRELKSKRFLD